MIARIIALLIALSVGALAGRWFTLAELDRAIDWPTTFSALADVAQVLALITAAWWTYRLFVRQRVDQDRADLSHSVQVIELGPTSRLVRITLEIKNVGNTELTPPSGSTTVSRAVEPASGRLTWVGIESQDLGLASHNLILEPGETERYALDFLLPHDISVIQVFSRVQCDGGVADEYWDESTVHVVGPGSTSGRAAGA